VDRGAHEPRLSIRLHFADGAMLGPGKANLLSAIATTGSIAAAGRSMGMSYKRAWYLVETLNGYFGAPLVQASKGGRSGGSAILTTLGQEVLAAYRDVEHAARVAAGPGVARLHSLRHP